MYRYRVNGRRQYDRATYIVDQLDKDIAHVRDGGELWIAENYWHLGKWAKTGMLSESFPLTVSWWDENHQRHNDMSPIKPTEGETISAYIRRYRVQHTTTHPVVVFLHGVQIGLK